MSKRSFFLKLMCVLCFGSMISMGRGGLAAEKKDKKEKELKTGDRAPRFTLRDMMDPEGKTTIDLDKIRKDSPKAIIISFFATWCKPCIKELPVLQQLSDLYGEAGLKIFIIATDKEKDKNKEIKSLMKEKNIKLNVLRDRFNIVMKRYGVSTLPSVFIFDGEGKLTFSSSGYEEGTMTKVVIPKVMELLRIESSEAKSSSNKNK